MYTLAFLVGQEEPGNYLHRAVVEGVIYADLICSAVSIASLTIAFIARKKGQPLRLPRTFWYFAIPAIAASMILIGKIVYAIAYE